MDLDKFALKTILNHITDALVMVDCNGKITLFNSAARKLTGREDVVGKDVRLVIPNTRLPEVLQTGTTELNQQQQLSDTTIITNRFPVRDESGKVMGAVAIFRDVSEVISLREQISTLHEIRTLLNAVFEATQDAISVVDENGLGILINPAYTRITGLTEADVINKPATVDIAEGESVHLKVLKTGEPMRNIPMKVGPKRKEVLVYGSPIVVRGKLRGSVSVIHDVSELRKLSEELDRVKRWIRHLESKYTFSDIIGESEAINSSVEKASTAAQTPVTILLRGESGTGKELFAHAIHHASNRANYPFIRVNCAALTESILESELFGYAEGAFTGAKRGGKLGFFEEANGGTLFLDEIGDITIGLQTKLLRVLQEKEIIRVGDNRTIAIDVRVIAATNVNLEEKIRDGQFRKDLYYRLNVFPIIIPSLHQRCEDIKILTCHLVNKLNQEYGRSVEGVSSAALQTLKSYHWPGNVRELENVIGRAIINMRSGGTIIEDHHLPQLSAPVESTSDSLRDGKNTLGETFEESYAKWEKDLLIKTLKAADKKKTKAAQLLKISIRNLYYKMEKHGLSK